MNPIRVQDHASIVILNCAFSWGNVTDKEITDEVTTDKHAVAKAIRVRKTLLPAAAGVHVQLVQTTLGAFYQYHCSKTYATPIKGQRVLPIPFYMAYEEKFAEAQAAGRRALDALVAGYPAAVGQAKALLGNSFKQDDYPDSSEISRYYTLERRFLPIPAGDHIMSALGASVAADVDSYVGTILTTAAADARKRLREAVARMAESLTKKGGRIYDSMPEAINELAQELPVIAGLTSDDGLQAMIKEVQDSLSGYSGDDFRNSDRVRGGVGKAAMELLRKMGG